MDRNHPRRHRSTGDIQYNAPVEQPTVNIPRTSGAAQVQHTSRIRPLGDRTPGEDYGYGADQTRRTPPVQPAQEPKVDPAMGAVPYNPAIVPQGYTTRVAPRRAPVSEPDAGPVPQPVPRQSAKGAGAGNDGNGGSRGNRPVKPEPGRTRSRRRGRKGVMFFTLVFIAIIAVVVMSCPFWPTHRATMTIAGNIVDTGADYTGLRISEVMTSNRSAVPDENGSFPDWVEIWNASDRVIDLGGVGLSDRSDAIRFLFPDISLLPDDRVVVFCDDTNRTDKVLHAKFKLSSVGETVYLYTPTAYEIDHVTIPMAAKNESYALIDGEWQTTQWYSPGYENSEQGNTDFILSTQVTDGDLVINEIMADVKTDLIGEGLLFDWVQLHNTTDHTIQLDHYALSDKANKPLRWRFPEGAVIAPGGYYVVYCSGQDLRDDPTAIPHTNFSISAEHDTVILSDIRGSLVDRVVIDNLPEDCSWGRQPDGTFRVFTLATPGLPNDQSGANQSDYNLRQFNSLGVYITEVVASNDTIKAGGETVDWIEIYNSTALSIDLSGYGLSDNIGRARKWQFPYGTVIAPGEYKIILCDRRTDKNGQGQLHAGFKIRRQGGQTVCLSTPEGKILDKITLPRIPTDISYGRTSSLAGFFYYDTPTPGAPNGQDGFRGYADEPQLTVPGGLYQNEVNVAIVVPQGTTVYYTLDGSIPTRQSTVYRGEVLPRNFTTVLRARAFSDAQDIRPSDIVTASYFINAYHTLPVVSVVCDPSELWDPDRGLLTVGANVVKEPGKLPFKNTVYRAHGKEPRPCHVSYYRTDGTVVIDQDCQFELAGAFSLDMPQKSMKFRAKSRYGSKTFAGALFPDRDFTEYKSFVLRNSGNDCMWTRLQDGFQHRLMEAWGTTVLHQAWNPVAVYLNGVYWGSFNMRERVDRFMVAQYEGLSFSEADDITILHGDGQPDHGSNKQWKAMIDKIKKGDPAKNPEDLQYILDNVDVDNYLEYMAMEMFVGNSDIGNIRFYRIPGGKWKWIFYDVDYGLYNSAFDSPKSYTKAKGMGQMNINNVIFRKLLTVPEYKDLFLTKLADVYRFCTTEKMLQILQPMVEYITPEMSLHWARWGEENDPYVISDVPTSADGAYRYWQSRVNRLRNVIKKRPNLLWEYIRDAFDLTNTQMIEYFGERPAMPADVI